jgi:hypothetical protein
MFDAIASTALFEQFLQSRMDEYPVTINGTTGKVDSCRCLVADHSAVTPKVKSIGSKNSHKNPMFRRP